MQLLTLFDGLGSVLGSKEVAEKAIAAYAEKKQNVGKWFEEAVVEGTGLMEVFRKSSFDQGEPAKKIQEELDKLRKEKERVDGLWIEAQQGKRTTKPLGQEVTTRRPSNEEQSNVKQASTNSQAAVVLPTDVRLEAEGKEASPPPPPVAAVKVAAVTKPSPKRTAEVAQSLRSSVEVREKVVRRESSETVSRWLTDEYAELEEEAYKVS